MAKKKGSIDEFQITMEELAKEKIKIYEVSEVKVEIEIKDNPQQEIPESVKKNNTHLMNEVMNVNIDEFEKEDVITLKVDDSTDMLVPITNKIALSFNESTIEKLTSFDKEVMDAVATLAPLNNVISASSIFRIISGKIDGAVNKGQRENIDKSMERCRKYLIEIDLTSEYLQASPHEKGNLSHLKYSGYLINFSKIDKAAKNGSNYYYKILEMPPIFRLAESIGKVSSFPLMLLDTPVQKTEQVIVTQGFLLREIDDMKKQIRESNFIDWEDLYRIADVTDGIRQHKARLRDYVGQILSYWKIKGFISEYQISNKSQPKGISIII